MTPSVTPSWAAADAHPQPHTDGVPRKLNSPDAPRPIRDTARSILKTAGPAKAREFESLSSAIYPLDVGI